MSTKPWTGRLRVKRRKGSKLAEQTLKSLCDLREEVMTFKTSALQQSERKKLHAYAQTIDFAYTIEDQKGSVFGVFLIDHLDHPSTDRAFLQIDYMYVHPALKGRSIYTWMLMRAGIDSYRRVRGKEIWFIAVGAFPLGYRSVWKFGGQITHSKDPDLPFEVRKTMIHLAQTQCGPRWNPETECIEIATVPPSFPPKVLERFQKEAWWEPYHEVCPHWAEGYGLLATYNISGKDFRKAIRNGIRRAFTGKSNQKE